MVVEDENEVVVVGLVVVVEDGVIELEVKVEVVVVDCDVVKCKEVLYVECKVILVWLVDVVKDCVIEVNREYAVVVTGSCPTVVEVIGTGS